MPPGLQWYWRADFFNDVNPEISNAHKKFRSCHSNAFIANAFVSTQRRSIARVAKDATPWAYRDAKYAGVIVGVDPDPANADKITQWCKDYWEALHPYSAGGAYLNFMMNEGQDRIKASYKHNYERLARIKKKYDPNNFFKLNQNILPEGSPQEKTQKKGLQTA